VVPEDGRFSTYQAKKHKVWEAKSVSFHMLGVKRKVFALSIPYEERGRRCFRKIAGLFTLLGWKMLNISGRLSN